MKIIYNGEIFNEDNFFISPLSKGFNYGDGFFTTIKVLNGKAQNLDLHIKRIKDSLNFFRYSIDIPKIKELIQLGLVHNNLTDARIKITFFNDKDRVSYVLFYQKLVADNSPVELKVSPFYRGNSELYRYKSLNYYENLKSGLTIYKDYKNRILETGFANIFIIKKNKILTPPETMAILPGTYRRFLLEKKELNGYIILEKSITLRDLKKSQEVFITNSIRGIVPVNKIEEKTYSTEITESLIKLLNTAT